MHFTKTLQNQGVHFTASKLFMIFLQKLLRLFISRVYVFRDLNPSFFLYFCKSWKIYSVFHSGDWKSWNYFCSFYSLKLWYFVLSKSAKKYWYIWSIKLFWFYLNLSKYWHKLEDFHHKYMVIPTMPIINTIFIFH